MVDKYEEGLIDASLDMLSDAERHFALNPDDDYAAMMEVVKIGRNLGFSDTEMEKTLGIRIKPEDRQADA